MLTQGSNAVIAIVFGFFNFSRIQQRSIFRAFRVFHSPVTARTRRKSTFCFQLAYANHLKSSNRKGFQVSEYLPNSAKAEKSRSLFLREFFRAGIDKPQTQYFQWSKRFALFELAYANRCLNHKKIAKSRVILAK